MSGSAALAGARRRRAAPPPTAIAGTRPQTQPQSQTQLLAQSSSQLPVHAQNQFPMASNGLSQGLTGQMGGGSIAYNPNLPLPPGIRGPVNVGQPVPLSVPSMAGGPPPIMVLKGHDDKLKDHEGAINDVSNRLNHLNSRLDKLEEDFNQFFDGENTALEGQEASSNAGGGMLDDQAYAELCTDLIDNRDFMSGIVDKIVNDTNLSEVIKQIEPVVVENRELRSLIHSQQEMLNHMSSLLYKLLNDNATVANVPKVITYVPPPRASAAADNDGPTFSTLAPIVSAPIVSAPIVSSSNGVSDYEPSSYIGNEEQEQAQEQAQEQEQAQNSTQYQEPDEENSGTVKLEVTHNDAEEYQGTDV